MPPSPTRKSSHSSPYAKPQPRRPTGQPKSSRQQFSACGACRMRRVRCDLKDLSFPTNGQQPQCSNCRERHLKCIDEFAEVKAVKLLRRGRRLQQVEAVYGKTMDEESGLFNMPSVTPDAIPKLRPEFFSSDFFRRLHIQHPIVDPSEFGARFFEFTKGNCNALPIAGQILAMVFVAWAVSFGVSEYGIEEPHSGCADLPARRARTNDIVRQILQLIDLHSILRRPSWDGVRALMLLIPLTHDLQGPMERLVTYETIVSQVFTLCSLASVSSVGSGQGQDVDNLVRARIFWYAHIVEGVTSGLRGGRLLLSDDDLAAFTKTLPDPDGSIMTRTSTSYKFIFRYASVPLQLATACRKIHAILTGPKARLQDTLDEDSLQEVWRVLIKSWDDFDALRDLGVVGMVQQEDTERYIQGWQMFIFECYNVIREALRQRTIVHANKQQKDVGSNTMTQDVTARWLKIADAKCHEMVVPIVEMIRRNMDTPFLEYDTTLARDGCFFAAFLLASETDNYEDARLCLRALHQMRWAYSKLEEREKTVLAALQSRSGKSKRRRLQPSPSGCDLRQPLSPLSIASSSSSPRSAVFLDQSQQGVHMTHQRSDSWESPPNSATSGTYTLPSTDGAPSTQPQARSQAGMEYAAPAPMQLATDLVPPPSPSSSSEGNAGSRRVSPSLAFYPSAHFTPYHFMSSVVQPEAISAPAVQPPNPLSDVALGGSAPQRDLNLTYTASYAPAAPMAYYPIRSAVYPVGVEPPYSNPAPYF